MVIQISGSLIWSKTLMELIFNPCGEFRWSPEGPVRQIHSPYLHASAPGISSDLLRFVQMLKREWGAGSTYLIPGKTAALVPEFAMEDLPSAELLPWFLRLQWRSCPCAEPSDDDDDDDEIYCGKQTHLFIPSKLQPLVSEFEVEDLPLGRISALVPSLKWNTCPWAEHPDNDTSKPNAHGTFWNLHIKIN